MAETKRYGLSGVKGNLELGKLGPRIKANAGVIEARNAADNAYVVVRGATPVGPNDLVTKAYFDTYGTPVVIGNIYDSGSSTPSSAQFTSTAQEGFMALCNETVGSFTTGHLYKLVTWNNTVAASTWTDISPAAGMQISTTVASSGGSPAFQADHVYIYDADGTVWVDIGPSSQASKIMTSQRATINFGSNSLVNIGDAVLANARIYQVIVNVTTPFDESPTLTIGDANDTDRLATNAEVDLNVAGVYMIDCYHNYATSTQITATYTQNGATAGVATIEVLYTTE